MFGQDGDSSNVWFRSCMLNPQSSAGQSVHRHFYHAVRLHRQPSLYGEDYVVIVMMDMQIHTVCCCELIDVQVELARAL